MVPEQNIKQNLSQLASKCNINLLEKDGVYKLTNNHFKIVVTILPKWVGIELFIYVDGDELLYETDTDNYNVDDPKHGDFRKAIALDVNAIITALLTSNLLVGEYKGRKSMVIPMHEGAIRIKKGWLGFSGTQFGSVEKASSTGSYSSLIIVG